MTFEGEAHISFCVCLCMISTYVCIRLCSFHVKQQIPLWPQVHLFFPPLGLLLFIMLAKGSIAVHHSQFQMTIGGQLLFKYFVLGGEHLADLHKGFVLGLRNYEVGVGGHSQADCAENQVTVRTCSHLYWEDVEYSATLIERTQILDRGKQILFWLYKAEIVQEKQKETNMESFCHNTLIDSTSKNYCKSK